MTVAMYACTQAANGIFHCEDCGICRVGKPRCACYVSPKMALKWSLLGVARSTCACVAGKRADYWHCEKCGSCYTVASRTTHKCVDRALESDCPICMEYLFTSVRVTNAPRLKPLNIA